MNILDRFSIKSTLILYIFSYLLFIGVHFKFFQHPHFLLIGALAYLAAYHAACGRLLFSSIIYGAGVGFLALNSVLPPRALFGPLPVDVGWPHLYFPFALAALIAYASVYAKGLARKAVSMALLIVAVLAGHFYMVYIGLLWRALVPSIGLAPAFPEPQDAPLYILLYELWRVVHQKPLGLCSRPQPASS